MIRKFSYRGDDVASDIRETFDFDGELLRLYAENKGPVVHKWHHYIPIYDRYFSRFRGQDFKFLEIGVSDGGSLQLWRKYFGTSATIFGIDINPACAQFDGQAGQVRIGSQDDPEFLSAVIEEMGGVDLVLDDGSHEMAHIETTLRSVFPKLSPRGVYMIEDLHTAYWPEWGGGVDADANFYNTVRRMIDGMHRWYHDRAPEVPEVDTEVSGIHIHDSIVVLEKGPGFRPVHSRIGG